MQRRRSHTVSILLGTSAKTALPGEPFRLGRIRLSRVLWLSVLVVMLGGLLEPEAAAQTVSFGAKTDFGTGIFPESVAVGDFNGDGNLDLAVANLGYGTPRTVSILLGTGTGSFGAKTEFVTGSGPDPNYLGGPDSVAVGDFNGDGKLDLVVTNLNSNTVSILLNTGPTGPIGFSLGFDSPTVTAQQGTKIRVTVNINRIGGFTGKVTVTPPEPAMGVIPKPPAPIATTGTSVTFKLRIKGGAPLGPHQVTFTAHDDSGHTIAVTLTVIVQ